MPGSGKSFLARRLSEFYGLPYWDNDAEVERLCGCSIEQLFSEKGEAFFRRTERQVLEGTADRSPLLVATGGGTPCFGDAMDWMLAQGKVIWINTPIEILQERLFGDQSRPLSKGKTREELFVFLKDLYERRSPVYARAHLQIKEAEPAILLGLFEDKN